MTGSGRVGLAMVAVLGALLLHNVVLLVRNQLSFDELHRYARQRPLLHEIAARGSHPDTRGRIALVHLLRARIGGRTVVVPPDMMRYAWSLERVARVRVEPVLATPTADPASPPDATLQLRDGRTVQVWFREGQERYVMAMREGAILVLPESMAAAAPRPIR